MKNKYTVLIVDDDKFLLEMYQKKFISKGFSVEIAAGSEETLSLLREGLKPDVVILDIIMPNMDGIELLENIRREKLVPEATVIMLTNESDRDKIEKAKILGARGYIVKAAVIPSEVVEEVLKIINSKNK